MRVYKFGGASVKSAEGVKNLTRILKNQSDDLVIVISAMGKTTNALEKVVNAYLDLQNDEAISLLIESKTYHTEIIRSLFDNSNKETILTRLDEIYNITIEFINNNRRLEYDFCYDQIVSAGEIASTSIVSNYLNSIGIPNTWTDAREVIRTDSTFREANIRFYESGVRLNDALDFSKNKIYITQGFIGGNAAGETTTLGREGSDYSAAIIAALSNAESVTIWKDVPGVLNADPRIFNDTKLLSAVSYKEAAELSFYGAQIIHPKTIKPLHNKNIPLYVKSFVEPQSQGTVIEGNSVLEKQMPVFILKKNQVLISILPKDFSFALEETLGVVFNMLLKHRIKVNLIQSSAVSISVCVDDTRYVQPTIEEFMNDYDVRYNKELELLTIRNYTTDTIDKYTEGKQVYLSQKTRRTIRLLKESK